MTDVYCDQTLVSGNDNGQTWANAYRLLPTALNGSNAGAGDKLWVQNNNASSGSVALKGKSSYTNNPLQVIGVKSGTTNEPPVAADLIPGLRTGDSTRAYAQTAGNAPPTFTTTTVGADIQLAAHMMIYGLRIVARDNMSLNGVETDLFLEECEIRASDGEGGIYSIGYNSRPFMLRMKNCKMSSGNGGGKITFLDQGPGMVCEGVEFDLEITSEMMNPGELAGVFDGCDFSSSPGAILGFAGGQGPNVPIRFNNCKIGAGGLVNGSISERFRAEFSHVSTAAGKTTGQSFQEIDIITSEGNIVEETTGVRASGADDGGSGAWALAYTPGVNGTRTNVRGLIGNWFHQKIEGDGTSKNLTIFIANNEGVDYQTDDVHAEVFFPSANGDADYDSKTTQLNLLGSAVDITDDIVSSWTAPASNPQKFVIPISPDYTGRLKWRVVFTRNFGATPKTLYVDGLSTIT